MQPCQVALKWPNRKANREADVFEEKSVQHQLYTKLARSLFVGHKYGSEVARVDASLSPRKSWGRQGYVAQNTAINILMDEFIDIDVTEAERVSTYLYCLPSYGHFNTSPYSCLLT